MAETASYAGAFRAGNKNKGDPEGLSDKLYDFVSRGNTGLPVYCI